MRARFAFGIMGYQYYDMSANKALFKYGGKSFGNKMKPAGGIEGNVLNNCFLAIDGTVFIFIIYF